MDPKLSLAARIGLNLLGLLGGIAVLRLGAGIFLPLIYATMLATILWPSANRLHKFYRLPWSVACVLTVGIIVFFNVILVAGFLLAVPRLLQSVPNAEDQIRFYQGLRENAKTLIQGREDHNKKNPPEQKKDDAAAKDKAGADQKKDGEKAAEAAKDGKPWLDDYLPADPYESRLFLTIKKTVEGEYIIQALFSALSYLSSYLWQFILVLFILLFLLMEGRMLTKRFVAVFGPSAIIQGKAVSALQAMSNTVRDFLVWRTIVNIGLAFVVGAVYQALGLRQAWVWGLLTGVLCYIPYIGPIIAAGPPLLDALIHCPSPWYALVAMAFYTGVIILEGYVIVPLLMGRHMDLNATTVMLACLFWELVWGVPGLFLAMPMIGALKAVCENVPGWEPWAALMSATDDGLPQPRPVDADRTVVMRTG